VHVSFTEHCKNVTFLVNFLVIDASGRVACLELLVEMVVPVAMMSGLMRPSSVGPIEEKSARLSKRSATPQQTDSIAVAAAVNLADIA